MFPHRQYSLGQYVKSLQILLRPQLNDQDDLRIEAVSKGAEHEHGPQG
jgi:hypothetical protein